MRAKHAEWKRIKCQKSFCEDKHLVLADEPTGSVLEFQDAFNNKWASTVCMQIAVQWSSVNQLNKFD